MIFHIYKEGSTVVLLLSNNAVLSHNYSSVHLCTGILTLSLLHVHVSSVSVLISNQSWNIEGTYEKYLHVISSAFNLLNILCPYISQQVSLAPSLQPHPCMTRLY
jgi:hypothetical protein